MNRDGIKDALSPIIAPASKKDAASRSSWNRGDRKFLCERRAH